jgi:hypothetical protein
MPRVETGPGGRWNCQAGAWKWSLLTALLMAGSAAVTFTLLVELFRSLC